MFSKKRPAKNLEGFLKTLETAHHASIELSPWAPKQFEQVMHGMIPVRYTSTPYRGHSTTYDEYLSPVLLPYVKGQEFFAAFATHFFEPVINRAVAFSEMNQWGAMPVHVQSTEGIRMVLHATPNRVLMYGEPYRGMRPIPPIWFNREEI